MAMYLALLYYDRDHYWDEPPEREFSHEYTEFAQRATAAGVMRGGEALHSVAMSTTITVSGGQGGEVMLIDGPYAEAKEVLGGYFVLETADLDEAIVWAAQIPASWRGGKIELRPIAPVTHAV
jgi:hypothetical protein